jgi:hypothetical protein
VPTYRIYYAERDPGTAIDSARYTSPAEHLRGLGRTGSAIDETEWEEEVEGADAGGALDAFFREHIRDNSELMWLDKRGDSHPVEGLSYEPAKTYIWIEDGKLMEYQGLDEGTPGMVSCPLCEGVGEVTVEMADEYLADYGEESTEAEEEERPTWG